jgi:hypothetical protein
MQWGVSRIAFLPRPSLSLLSVYTQFQVRSRRPDQSIYMLYTYCLILLYTTTTSSSGWYKRHIVYCIYLDGLPATYTSYCMCDDCDVFFGSTHFPPLFWSKHSIVCATSFRKTARVGWETWREKKISDTKNKTGTSSCCLFVRVTGWYDKSKVDILWSYINYQYRLIPKLLIEIQTKVWKWFFFFSPW